MRFMSINKLICLNLLSTGMAILAIAATILGGIVLAFDKSLWPLDGQILYVGHISLVLVIPTSALSFTKGYTATPRLSAMWLVTQGTIFVLATTVVILTYPGMFNYGLWPS
jgi:hypothetical protein